MTLCANPRVRVSRRDLLCQQDCDSQKRKSEMRFSATRSRLWVRGGECAGWTKRQCRTLPRASIFRVIEHRRAHPKRL